MNNGIFVGGGAENYSQKQELLLKYGNRHGLIAGATGTGKTVTLQILAEGFSKAGVPVFLSDVKGDLSGLANSGRVEHKLHDAFEKRATKINYTNYLYEHYPVIFWDLFGKQGHPIRTTISDMGPLLLSRLLGLSEAQEGVINVAFRVSDEQGLPLLDLKDLRALLSWCGQNADELTLEYGNVSKSSIGAIQRSLLVLENQGGTYFFGEPALDIQDLFLKDEKGFGCINILSADQLMLSPGLYATFLLWLLSELFEELPEVGNPDKPKLVFFFDEAHLLFDDAPKALVDKVEQVARLIRSKGVGVYFVTQNPDDIPEDILSQLGNRVQHALRAFTARDQKALQMAAQTYRPNPSFDIETAIKEVGTGEAVTSFLEEKGVPGMAQRTLIRPPSSQLGPIEAHERQSYILNSPLSGKYEQIIDRKSASEMLKARAQKAAIDQDEINSEEAAQLSAPEKAFNHARRYSGRSYQRSDAPKKTSSSQNISKAFGNMLVKELTGTTGRRIVRGILGSFFKGR